MEKDRRQVPLAIPTARRGVRGVVRLPGSKSMTHRGLVIGALAGGVTRIVGASLSDDCQRTAEALRRLGAKVTAGSDESAVIEVRGWGDRPTECPDPVDAGESGTTARFLLPLLTLGRGRYELCGGPRLGQRPMDRLVGGLRALGAIIRRSDPDASLPLLVDAAGLEGGTVELDASQSSQFASALLLAAPAFRRGLTLSLVGETTASRPYLEMTCSLMARFGVPVEREGMQLRVPAGVAYRSRDLEVEGDASSASYFFTAAAVCGGTVRCMPLDLTGSDQGDVRFVRLLERMGCTVRNGTGWVEVSGDGQPLRALETSMNDMPDMVPTLAVAALFARGRTMITSAAHLRWKESDRLGELARELGRLGGRVEQTADGLVIEGDGGKRLTGARLGTGNDHRMAMSLALAGLRLPDIEIENPGCVAKSHPGFFRDLFSLVGDSG